MAATGRTAIFGRRQRPITLVVARGDSVRHVTLSARTMLAGGFALALSASAAFFAPALLVPDDAAATAATGETALRRSYESRIAVLRSQLDEATSRQIVAQKMVESKVDVLLDQQEEIAERYARLEPLLARARRSGVIPDMDAVPVPAPRPETARGIAAEADMASDGQQDDLDAADTAALEALLQLKDADGPDIAIDAIDEVAPASAAKAPSLPLPEPALPAAAAPTDRESAETAQRSAIGEAGAALDTIRTASLRQSAGTDFDAALKHFGRAIDRAGDRQVADLRDLAFEARERASEIAAVLRQVGVHMPLREESALGGPYEPVDEASGADPFDLSYSELEDALETLEAARSVTSALPFEAPMAAGFLSSRFGVRSDPFLGRRAFHAGIDYAVANGTPIRSTAAGTVVTAGRSGGYGNLVEIDHGNGVTTRYGHMSAIAVSVGDTLTKGDVIGRVGSTGRSTGPHLHYEIRRDDRPIDPMRFIRIGDKLRAIG